MRCLRAGTLDLAVLAQIPPFRLLGALTGSRGQVDVLLEVDRVSAQHRTALR